MAEKSEETGRDGPGQGGGDRSWIEGVMGELEALVSRAVRDLAAAEDKPGDVAFVDQRAKAITNLARAAKMVDGLRARPRTPPKDSGEDGMDTHYSDGVDDEELERIRTDLERRLDRLRGQIETKAMARQLAEGGAGRDERCDAEPPPASGSAAG